MCDDMAGFRRMDISAYSEVLDLLEAGYLRLKKAVAKTIMPTLIEFEVNDGGGSGKRLLLLYVSHFISIGS